MQMQMQLNDNKVEIVNKKASIIQYIANAFKGKSVSRWTSGQVVISIVVDSEQFDIVVSRRQILF